MKEYLAARTRMDTEDSPRPLTAAGLVPVADYHSTEGSVPGVGPEHNREVSVLIDSRICHTNGLRVGLG